MSSRLALLALLALSLCASGCGGIGDGDSLGVPLHVLRGHIEGSLPDAQLERPTMAVTWSRAASFGLALASESSPIEAELPQDFAVSFFHEPPDNLFTSQGGLTAVSGVYAAYDDGNGNGALDTANGLLSQGTSVYPDRLFAYSPSDFIFVVRALPPPGATPLASFVNPQDLQLGWNLVRLCQHLEGNVVSEHALVLPIAQGAELVTTAPTGRVDFQVALLGTGPDPRALGLCGG